MRLKGIPSSFERLRLAASTPGEHGQSLLDIKNLAARHGVDLLPVQLGPAIDGPLILHLNRPPRGHFVVIRPVGHTGKLVQVIDGARDPVVLDLEALRQLDEWSGYALIPRRGPNRWVVIPAASGAILAGWLAWSRARQREARSAVTTPES
jgi:hypothetical protein